MNTLIILSAKYLFLVVLLGTAAIGLKLATSKRVPFFILLITSGILAFIFLKLASFAYYDPRPFVSGHFVPLIPHAADNGFPSDHTTLSMIVALVGFHYNKKLGSLLVVLAVLVGVARVLAGVHSPLDIVGAILIALLAYSLTRQFLLPLLLKQLPLLFPPKTDSKPSS